MIATGSLRATTPMETDVSLRRSLAYILWLSFLILGNARPKVNMKREEREREREREREKSCF